LFFLVKENKKYNARVNDENDNDQNVEQMNYNNFAVNIEFSFPQAEFKKCQIEDDNYMTVRERITTAHVAEIKIHLQKYQLRCSDGEQLPEIFLEEGGRGTETHKRPLVLWVLA
jgi:hypothetical protein